MDEQKPPAYTEYPLARADARPAPTFRVYVLKGLMFAAAVLTAYWGQRLHGKALRTRDTLRTLHSEEKCQSQDFFKLREACDMSRDYMFATYGDALMVMLQGWVEANMWDLRLWAILGVVVAVITPFVSVVAARLTKV